MILILPALNALPGQRPSEEIHQHEAYTLQIVPSRLLVTSMSVDRAIPCSSGNIFVIFKRNVAFFGAGPVLLGEAEVDDVQSILALVHTHHEVIGLYIPVNVVLIMHVLNSFEHFQA